MTVLGQGPFHRNHRLGVADDMLAWGEFREKSTVCGNTALFSAPVAPALRIHTMGIQAGSGR